MQAKEITFQESETPVSILLFSKELWHLITPEVRLLENWSFYVGVNVYVFFRS